MGIIKRSFTIWGVLLLICIVSFFTRGLSQSIDFTGGRNFVVQFDRVVQPETVRDLLDAKVGDANVQAIALGTDGKRIRVMTNYRIEENDPKVDSEIESAVYIPEGRQSGYLKALLSNTLSTVIRRTDVRSSVRRKLVRVSQMT